MIGLTSKLATFKVQRAINTNPHEPLTALLPGVALTQLWQMSRGLDNTLRFMARLMLLAALLGLAAMLLASLRERRYELAVMRTLGASALTVLTLIQLEILFVTALGILLGSVMLGLLTTLANPWVITHYGIDIGLANLSIEHIKQLLWVALAALGIGAVPAGMGFITAKRL